MIRQIIESFLLIFFAEMGDKTQILALAFAIKYSISHVLMGIFIGSSLSHILAVIIGVYLSTFMSGSLIGVISGIVFILFGLKALGYEEDEDTEGERERIHPIITVAVAFFIGELGDKTQLATMALAAQSPYPYLIPIGSVLAMLATGFIGIVVGKKIGGKIPELAIKVISSIVFILFGILKLYETSLIGFKGMLALVFLLIVIYTLLFKDTRNKYKNSRSKLQLRSSLLYEYFNEMKKTIEDICLGTGQCITCDGSKCVIGNTREILNVKDDLAKIEEIKNTYSRDSLYKDFNRDEIENLIDTIDGILYKYPNTREYSLLKIIRDNLENIKNIN